MKPSPPIQKEKVRESIAHRHFSFLFLTDFNAQVVRSQVSFCSVRFLAVIDDLVAGGVTLRLISRFLALLAFAVVAVCF